MDEAIRDCLVTGYEDLIGALDAPRSGRPACVWPRPFAPAPESS